MAKWMGLFLLFACFACGDKKASLSGDAPVDAEDFTEAFPTMTLPATLYDSALNKLGDTTTISYAVFSQFIPDSVLSNILPASKTTVIRPLGRIDREEERYLLSKFIDQKKMTVGVFVFDKKNKFLGGRALIGNGQDDGYRHFVSINREPTFTVSREKIKNNQLFYTRTGLAFSKDVGFMAIANESNEDAKKLDSVINPIDTFKKLNKLSGDYLRDKKNFISLRDGRNPNTYLLFIHFEKTSDCGGELKGELVMKDDRTGQYTATGDPCVINFKFSGSRIEMKEEGSCGNHRGIKCFFDDAYTKKKEARPKPKKK
jgi:hypothetical protein